MRIRDGVTVGVVAVLAAAAVVAVPAGVAGASPTLVTETYDAYANSGAGTPIATSVTTFTLDNITYATDQASTTWVESSGAPLSTGATDGVLFMNYDGTPMTSVTIKLANGDPMTVSSFDFDSGGSSGTIELIPDGKTANELTLTGGQLSGHVDLSANTHFVGVTTIQLLDVGDSTGIFTPTPDNFAYEDLNSPPSLTATSGSTSFVPATTRLRRQ